MAKNKNKKQDSPGMFSDPYRDTSVRDRQVQQRVFISLIILSFVALGLGGWHIARQLQSPFDLQPTNTANTNTLAVYTNTNQTPIESLRDKDTDNDGVSDYDEFYIFKTSPYIADSDSDGITDKAEIDQGADPNCPEGKDCGNQTTDGTDDSATDLFPGLDPTPTTVVNPNDLTADELRTILRDAGASEEELSSIPDNELVQTYQEVVDAYGAQTSEETEATEAITIEALQQLSIDEIRQFLIESGVPEETLNEVDDETLQEIFNESLQQNTETEEPAS